MLFFAAAPLMAQPLLKIGEPPPAFTLPALDGQAVTVPLVKKGPAVIVHFWTGTCRSCLREMPIIETLYQQYKDKDVLVYAVNIGEPESNVKDFVKKLKITFPILLDADMKVSGQFGVSGIPRTFFIDRKGMLRKKLLGEAPLRVFDQLIKEIL
jgi:peroxiredoxin